MESHQPVIFLVAATCSQAATSVNECECEGASKMSKLQRLNSLGIAEISGVRVRRCSQSFKTATIIIRLMQEIRLPVDMVNIPLFTGFHSAGVLPL